MRSFGFVNRRSETARKNLASQRAASDLALESADPDALRAEAERLRWERDQALERVAGLERSRRGGGLAALGVGLAVALIIGLAGAGLAKTAGSFAAGGAVVDAQLAQTTQPARQAAADAAQRSGQAVEQAGQSIEAQGRKLQDVAVQ